MANSHPSIKWGQKKDHILLTIAVQDIEKPEIHIKPTELHFRGQQTKGLKYDTILELFDEIDPKASKYRKTSQNHWEFMLKKKDPKKPFWKRLIKSTEKCSWIVVDWDHFAAEDDEEDLDGAPGKDWSNLDAMLNPKNTTTGGGSPIDLNDLDDDNDNDSDEEAASNVNNQPSS